MNRTIDLRNPPPTGSTAVHRDTEGSAHAEKLLDPRAIAFVTLVNNEAQYATCLRYIDALQVPSGYTVEKIAVFGAASMAEGCQRGMEASTARYKIYLHQDVYVIHRRLLSELVDLFRTHPRLGLAGVVGTTRMSARGIWWVNNPFHCYGRVWVYAREGGFPMALLGRRLHLQRFRRFVGDYLPAVAVDGLFIATQYDIPWVDALGGFELYDQVQALEFIKAGLEVGIARQEATWCIHWGPPQERTGRLRAPREIALHRRAAVFRQLNPAFIGVPARTLYVEYRQAAGSSDKDSPRDRLGVLIAAFNGREALLRTLRALLPQCEALRDVNPQVVVVGNGTSGTSGEAVRREFPQVTMMPDTSDDTPVRALNMGLRHLDFPNYVLIMHDDAELSPGTLSQMVTYLQQHPSTAGVIAGKRQPITFVGTICAMTRGEVFFDVGLYDERFWFPHKDLDWSLRARRKGYKFGFLPEAGVIRHQAASSQNRPAISAERVEANLRLVHKHAGRRWAIFLYAAQWLLARWLSFRHRNDSEALRYLGDALTRSEGLYRTFREENRPPQLS